MLPPLNVSHQSSTCLILELGLHFKLFDFVEFCKIIFLAVGSKNNLWQNSTQSKSLISSLYSNQAGVALVIHIKWLRALFFAMAKVVESKGDTLNTIMVQHRDMPLFPAKLWTKGTK